MKKIKKGISIILISFIIVSIVQSSVVFADDKVLAPNIISKDEVSDINENEINLEKSIEESTNETISSNAIERVADVQAPVLNINSLKIDKKEVKAGDKIKISLKASDDISGIDYINVWYNTPITNKSEYIRMIYNSSLGVYQGELEIDKSKESGVWKIDCIYLKDNSKNYVYVYNKNVNNYGTVLEDLSAGDFKVSGTTADVKAPVLDVNSLKIDKKEVKAGDKIKISLKATDDISGIDYINVWYKMPTTNKSENINMIYNNSLGLYQGELEIDKSKEAGVWKIDCIYLKDNSKNYVYVYNKNVNNYGTVLEDLSAGDFKVSGTTADVKAPVLDVNSLKIDKKEVKAGDKVKISLKASDDVSGIDYINVWYKTPITNKSENINMIYNNSLGLYQGEVQIDESKESGVWKINCIYLKDNSKNYVYVYNNNINTYGTVLADLSAGDFNVKEDEEISEAIEGIEVVTKNEYWTNKTINGDLYIGPEAIVTVNGGVTVTGNVYVLGALKTYGGLTIKGKLYGKNMILGSSSILYNGSIVMSGSNDVFSINISNYPVEDIPMRVDSAVLLSNGSVDIQGATINVAEMYIESKKVDLDYKGRFNLKNISIANKNKVKVEFITVFGNKITKEIAVFEKEDVNKDGKIDIVDLAKVAKEYNKNNYSNNWISEIDLNKDNIIDLFDLVLISKKI